MLTHGWRVTRTTTPGATPTAVLSFDPTSARPEGISGDFQGEVEVRIRAAGLTGRGRLRRVANIERVAGTLARVGTALDLLAPVVDVALTGIATDLTVSGANVQVSVTGLAATSITWDVDVETRIYHG